MGMRTSVDTHVHSDEIQGIGFGGGTNYITVNFDSGTVTLYFHRDALERFVALASQYLEDRQRAAEKSPIQEVSGNVNV